MLLERWRARRALLGRTAPWPIEDEADARLLPVVEDLAERLGASQALEDRIVHHRREGELTVAGLDATIRSVSDVRQRALRLVHELALRHLPARARRVVVVVLCDPQGGETVSEWLDRLWGTTGTVSEPEWAHALRRLAVLAIGTDGSHHLRGGHPDVEAAVSAWAAA